CNEIVLVDGFRLGKAATCALLQSKYWLESFFSQNARSAASLENFGLTLGRLLINLALLPAHVACRDHSDQLAVPSKGEGDVQASTVNCLAERVISRFGLAVRGVRQHQHRSVEEHLLRLSHGSIMPIILPGVTVIPVEAGNLIEDDHACILWPY